jgi:protein SCO1/2
MITRFEQYCRNSNVPIVTVFILLFLSSVVFAQNKDVHAQHKEMLQQQSEKSANFADIVLPDAVLLTQDGAEVRLQNDVVGDRIVVMNFVYTTCTTVCPVLSAIFSQVQNQLGERLGPEVVLVSLSVDPLRDTPARLKQYSERLGAADSWFWLTGQKQTVTEVLTELGAYTPNFADHPSMVLVGDGQSGQWARFVGFPGADQIVKKVDEFTAVRMANL